MAGLFGFLGDEFGGIEDGEGFYFCSEAGAFGVGLDVLAFGDGDFGDAAFEGATMEIWLLGRMRQSALREKSTGTMASCGNGGESEGRRR